MVGSGREAYCLLLSILKMNRTKDKIKMFLIEARQEFKHVNWPTRQEATRLTLIVIGISLAIAVFMGVFDYLFSYGLKALLFKQI